MNLESGKFPKIKELLSKPRFGLLGLKTYCFWSSQTTLPIQKIVESKKLTNNIKSIPYMKFQFLKLPNLIQLIYLYNLDLKLVS